MKKRRKRKRRRRGTLELMCRSKVCIYTVNIIYWDRLCFWLFWKCPKQESDGEAASAPWTAQLRQHHSGQTQFETKCSLFMSSPVTRSNSTRTSWIDYVVCHMSLLITAFNNCHSGCLAVINSALFDIDLSIWLIITYLTPTKLSTTSQDWLIRGILTNYPNINLVLVNICEVCKTVLFCK